MAHGELGLLSDELGRQRHDVRVVAEEPVDGEVVGLRWLPWAERNHPNRMGTDHREPWDAAPMSSEGKRLQEARDGVPWRAWGPYLSERQWGTVREDYSDDGDAWSYFSHDQARSRAYHWGEDGLAGISDEKQHLCLALALWNGRDPIIKERLFGLTNAEGNHGEDVKEYYFYVDNLPTHSYQRWLYKYPHAEFPYDDLVDDERAQVPARHGVRAPRHRRLRRGQVLRRRGRARQGRARRHPLPHHGAQPVDRDRVVAPAADAVVPQHVVVGAATPTSRRIARVDGGSYPTVRAEHGDLGVLLPLRRARRRALVLRERDEQPAVWGTEAATRFPKDGINDHVVHGAPTVNPADEGTKVAAHVMVTVAGGDQATTLVRLTRRAPESLPEPFADADELFSLRRAEADEFYDSITPPGVDDDSKSVMRQALAGMLWSKQTYYFDLDVWLRERQSHPLRSPTRRGTRNESWFHMVNQDVISMPDKWEYPWYAAWDLAFHCIPLAMVDPDFAKNQLRVMLSAAVPASERTDARLRVELRRRQPAGARVRDARSSTASRLRPTTSTSSSSKRRSRG